MRFRAKSFRQGSRLNARTIAALASATLLSHLSASTILPLPDRAAPVIADQQDAQVPDRVRLTGWVGTRMAVNESNRLAMLDVNRLLEGYRKRPGRQSWDGEHVGKWLHAATLAWVNTGDPLLRQKLDFVAAELVKCQLPDGYLGTYLEKDRWTEWDVWAHKYNLIGLITYMRYTGNQAPLSACRRMADLLCQSFGDGPGQRDIIAAGFHMGMAPTSVLEPMVLLYRMTGETRYLDFCKYILRSWEQPNGPKIISTLLTAKRVDKVGNAKAYEMLSCLNGALEFYRTVGDRKILEACLNAWQDIVHHRLYPTGTASYREHFHGDFDFPNVNDVGETCVTVTWLQFNAQLLRLTGERRFADEIEKTVLNQLMGAQSCDGAKWGYYVQMEGRKPYKNNLDGNCCLSSGPRGLALIATFALTTDADGVVDNLYDAGTARLTLRDGTPVALATQTQYPASGDIEMEVRTASKKPFAIKLRIPSWSQDASVQVNGSDVKGTTGADGYLAIRRLWRDQDTIQLRLNVKPRILIGDHKNQGKLAVLYGPLVLAADAAASGEQVERAPKFSIPGPDPNKLRITPEAAPATLQSWPGARVFRMTDDGTNLAMRLVPFADAGATGANYQVWLPFGPAPADGNLLLEGLETRSRNGNVDGSIIDDDFQTPVVTFDGKAAAQDWFAVSLPRPVAISRIVFAHGRTFHDGGWFDASAGKPRVQIKSTKDGPWEDLCEIKDYPSTTATDPAGLKGGECFTCRLEKPVDIAAIRVIGKPACGDNAEQAFSSCAELQAFNSRP
jgi:DUF1680 family protein